MTSWIQTFTGKKFDPFNLDPENDIDIDDIAVGLTHCQRFAGQTPGSYTVAEHSIFVASIMWARTEDVVSTMCALLHDAPEAYIGDIPSPLKRHLPDYMAMEARIMAGICHKFELPGHFNDPQGEKIWKAVDVIDRHVLGLEAHVLFPNQPENWATKYASKDASNIAISLKGFYGDTPGAIAKRFHAVFDQLVQARANTLAPEQVN